MISTAKSGKNTSTFCVLWWSVGFRLHKTFTLACSMNYRNCMWANRMMKKRSHSFTDCNKVCSCYNELVRVLQRSRSYVGNEWNFDGRVSSESPLSPCLPTDIDASSESLFYAYWNFQEFLTPPWLYCCVLRISAGCRLDCVAFLLVADSLSILLLPLFRLPSANGCYGAPF